MPGAAPATPPGRRRSRGLLIGGAVGAVLTLAVTYCAVVLVTAAVRAPRRPASPQAVSPTTATGAPTTTVIDTPATRVLAALNRSAQALLHGDEAGWLAIVDPGQPKVRAYYRDLYASLRGLGVTQLEYHYSVPKPVRWETTRWDDNFYLTYCFSLPSCPKLKYTTTTGMGAPMITQGLTISKVGKDDYRISNVGPARMNHKEEWQSTPWQVGPLVLAQGKRVTVGASRGHAKRLKEVLAAAERAATRADHYADLLGNPQRRYRVYMATDEEWRSWFGTTPSEWVTGYTTFPENFLGEVVLRMSKARSGRELQELIQHEMGHVVTLGGSDQHRPAAQNLDMWLQEGIAEYIAYAPRPATDSVRVPVVRQKFRTDPPSSIALKTLDKDAGLLDGNAFYGVSHLAVDCIARRYGERKLFDFVATVMRPDSPRNRPSLDTASRQVFGTPFRSVDRACVAQIKRQL
ncbi:hypothetical protein [Krasilnikovia sp. M28-CT-15]|uniref:hypothetical protein n=1 Tax=Krasilnikovia sp. M28-CT-15 TaxID=3373540 RepID=UPI00399C5150